MYQGKVKKMKKTLLVVTALLATIVAAFSLTGCGEDKQLSITIANKDALTAAWVEGEAARTLEITLAPEDYTLENTNVIVESSNSDVVDVDGFNLKAVGGGTATITVKAGEATDSVEITVTPSFKGVAITNKTALAESWIVGAADRTVELAFSPEYYNLANTGATITSDNTDVVTVSGTTLHAVAIGTATITVKAGDFSDSVVVSVRPAIETLTVTNKTDLGEEWAIGTERTIEAAFTPGEYTMANTTPTITCEPSGAIEVTDGWKIKAKAVGRATVTVSAQGKTDSFEITVAHAAPVISLSGPGLNVTEEGGEMSAMQDAALTIPTATAMTTDGVNVTGDITTTYSDENKLHVSGLLMTPDVGVYTITYTVKNPADASKVTTKTVTVTVYRKVFSWTDNTWQVLEEKVANAEQKVTTTTNGYQTAQFNLAASRYYYAEATFHITEWSNVGIANFVPDNNHTRWLSAVVQTSGDVNYKFADFDTSKFNGGAWNLNENAADGITILNQYRLTEFGNLNASTDGTHKVAILRLGDTYYSFWNDQYVDSAVFEYYADVETIPGFFTLGLDASKGYATAIDYFSGESEVRAKLNALTHNGKDFIRNYVPDGGWAGDSKNLDNRNFTKNDTTAERGINFDFTKNDAHFNGGMVSPYVWFDGDFTFSWDHKATSTTGSSRRMILEMRSRMWYNDARVGGIQFGAEYNDDASLNRYLLSGSALAEAYKWYEPGAGTDGSAGSRFTISRKLFDDYAEITLTAQSLANPDQRFTRVITVSADATKSSDGTTAFDGWNEPVILQWHNTGVAGEYSNINWTARSAERIESLEITNKEALTAAWVEGESARNVEVTLAPKGYTLSNTKYSITSSNPSVVAANGTTIGAVGGGTATVTVRVGMLSDSFEVTVTPSLKTVTIENKSALVSWREDEEATRALVLSFDPSDVYNLENSELSIVSDNPDVVSVNGTTLTRGNRGTAKITVTAKGGVTDEVTISVLPPAIQGISVSNKTELEADWEYGTWRTIAATFDPSDYNTSNTVPTVTASENDTIEVDGWMIKPVKVGTAVITVTVQDKSDTFTITVVNGAPTISLTGNGLSETEEGGAMSALQGTALDVPTMTAYADGADVTENVVIEYSDQAKLHIEGGKMTPEIGTHTITYTVKNPADATKTATKVVTINVYRKVFSWTNTQFTVDNEMTSNAEQTVKVNKDSYEMAQFNLEASDAYYVEVTFKNAGWALAGIANFVPDDNHNRALVSLMPTSGNADYKIIDFNPSVGGWNVQENDTSKNLVIYQYQACKQGGLTKLAKDGDFNVTRLGIVRVGRMFYMFYNDQYIGATDMAHYASVNTIPGLFVWNMPSTDIITGIDYFSGKEAAVAKLNALTGNGRDYIRQYVPYDWASGSKNTDNDHFTRNEATTERGVNFDFTKNNADFNDGMVSPYVWFSGDFTFSWDYKATSTTDGESRMIVEMRTLIGYDHNSCGGIQFGAQYNDDASLNRYLLSGAGLAEGHKWNEPGAGTDATAGSRFTISRKIYDDHAEITLTATSLTDPTKTFTRTINIGATADKSTDGTTAFEGWNRVVILQWHNTRVAGEYSNISWTSDSAN